MPDPRQSPVLEGKKMLWKTKLEYKQETDIVFSPNVTVTVLISLHEKNSFFKYTLSPLGVEGRDVYNLPTNGSGESEIVMYTHTHREERKMGKMLAIGVSR